MAINLVRNSKVFFTTNIDTSGVIKASSSVAFSAGNTTEIQVLDGFTFSQNVTNETVTTSEAGTAPVRGQRAFNTALAPVDFSFSTYLRPKLVTGSPDKTTSEDSVLWNALLSDTMIGATSITGVGAVTVTTAGVMTITGTGMTTLPATGAVITLSGFATTTPGGSDKYLNGVGTVTGTPSGTAITIQLLNYDAVTAITAVTLATATTLKWSKAAWGESNASYSQVTTGLSDKNQLQKCGFLFLVDNVMYAVDNAALTQVTIDFGIDAIATAQWTGQATALREFDKGVTLNAGAFVGGAATGVASGAYTPKVTSAPYITNKLSTIVLTATKALGSGTNVAAGDTYVVPITGGSFTYSNNITYMTPAILGIVNQPTIYYTGARSVSGSLTAYLRTGGSKDTGELLSDLLLEAGTAVEPMFGLIVNIGGVTAATARVSLDMPAVVLGVPAINVEQVISTTINFTAQGYTPNTTVASTAFDLTKATDLAVRYYGI